MCYYPCKSLTSLSKEQTPFMKIVECEGTEIGLTFIS